MFIIFYIIFCYDLHNEKIGLTILLQLRCNSFPLLTSENHLAIIFTISSTIKLFTYFSGIRTYIWVVTRK